MQFNLTDQQQAIIAEICQPTAPMLAIKATAGAAKSSTISEAIKQSAKTHPHQVVQVLLFNTVPAAEMSGSLAGYATVSTLHKLAYSHTVKQYGFNRNIASYLTWRDIPKSIRRPFGIDSLALSLLDEFCLSGHLSLDSYFESLDEPIELSTQQFIRDLLAHMLDGAMRITHSFYLKYFHIMVVNGTIQLPPVDKLVIDEVNDSSLITLDVFDRIEAKQRIIIGDPNQSILEFLNLVDGFQRYPDAKQLPLSKSFRVSNVYAPAIQSFLRTHLDPSAEFIGMDYPDDVQPVTTAYLTRTNLAIIEHMIECNQVNRPYRLATSSKLNAMFKLPLALIYGKPGYAQKDPELQHIQADIDDWGRLSVTAQQRTSKLSWLIKQNPDDPRIKSAVRLITKFGPDLIIDAYKHADEHRKSKADYLLATAYSVKGITVDSVIIADDLNDALDDILHISPDSLTEQQRALICVYFVAITRARYSITNATHLFALT